MARKRLVTNQAAAEKWLAMELTILVAVKLVEGFRAEGGGLLGPSGFVPPFIAFGMLSLLVMWDQAAEVAVILGLLMLLATLLRPVTTKDGGTATSGRLAFQSLAGAAEKVAAAGPKYAQPVKEAGTGS